MENLFKELFTKNETINSKTAEAFVSVATSKKTMENQLGQIHKVVFERHITSLHSQPKEAGIVDKKKKEKINAIRLRSVKEINSAEKENELVNRSAITREEEVNSE